MVGGRLKAVLNACALIAITALVAPHAVAGSTGAVPFFGDDPASGTRTVTIADITDFHGHIERGSDNAVAFTLADSHNPGHMVPVSSGDLVGGSPYDSAVAKDRPTLDMAKAWGLTISAVGNHELDRGVADFNTRIADPANGIDWLCANVSARNKSAHGKLSRVKDYAIRKVNGKRIGFVGALTDALGSVATPRITRDADLRERAVDAINRVAHRLKSTGTVDAVVALLHADAGSAQGIGADVDVIYAGHTHGVKGGTSDGGAPIIEAGSYGRDMAVQDLVITGSGRHARVSVANVDLGNGTGRTAVDGVLQVQGLDAHPRQAAWMSAGAMTVERVMRAQGIYDSAKAHARRVGDRVVDSLGRGTNFSKDAQQGDGASIGTLVADANRATVRHAMRGDPRIPVIGFSNNGSLRADRLDQDGDGLVTVREVDTLLALQFKAAYETLTADEVRQVLSQQFSRSADGRLERRWLGISSNIRYRYEECSDRSECAARIVDLTIDGRPVDGDEPIVVASNSYLLQGGDRYSAFTAGTGYRELAMSYSRPLHDYLAAHPLLSPDGPAGGASA